MTGIERIADAFRRARDERRTAVVAFLAAGDPDYETTVALARAAVAAGADLIELGSPFSDPLADGPTIQRSSQRAIAAGATLASSLEALAEFRGRFGTPVVLFTYLNPLLAYGVERFIRDVHDAGADGVLLTDLPVDGDAALERAFEDSPLDLVRLLAPTTPPERAARIAARAQGFLYYISRTGVTGTTRTLRDGIAREVEAIRPHAAVPIAVGFGISSPAQAAEVARASDGVVVGSALIEALDRDGMRGLYSFVGSLREALDGARG